MLFYRQPSEELKYEHQRSCLFQILVHILQHNVQIMQFIHLLNCYNHIKL